MKNRSLEINLDWLKIKNRNIIANKGDILISEPIQLDDMFSKSVVFIVEEMEDSHLGYIISNKSEMKVADVMDDFDGLDYDLFIGGPVEQDVLGYVHSYGNIISNSIHVAGNIYVGGDYNDVINLAKFGLLEKSKIKFFIGYTGWDKEQLQDEIDDNLWLVANINHKLITENTSNIWEKSLKFIDEKFNIWKLFPKNPEDN